MTLGNDNGTDGQTDGQTDRQTECDAICGPLLRRRAACQRARASKVISPFIIFAVVDVSFR